MHLESFFSWNLECKVKEKKMLEKDNKKAIFKPNDVKRQN